MSEHSSEAAVPEIAFFFAQQILKSSELSTTAILECRQGRIKKLLSRFWKNPDQKRQRLKLQFHLFTAYLAVLVVDLQLSEHFLPHTKQIVDGIVEMFYKVINERSKHVDAGLVIGDEFIKDPEERKIILTKLRRVDPKIFGKLSELPRLGFNAIADMLLEKRLNEYREIWIDDMTRIGQHHFIAMMPTRVYQHWSGDNSQSSECLTFNLLLFGGLMPFSTATSQALGMMKVKQ